MKIVALKTFVVGNPWKNWVYVKLYTDEGITGLGEATGGLQTQPHVAAFQEFESIVVGQDPRRVLSLWDDMHKRLFLSAVPALSALEQACWDILGKSLNVPVWQLLGGLTRPRLRAYANGWYKGTRDPESFAERALEIVAEGYTALKFDPFGHALGFLDRKEFRLSLGIVEAVREAVGEDVDLLIEGHDRLAVAPAIEFGCAMADLHPMWFETPVLSTDISATLAVASRIPVPVAAGERFDSLTQFSAMLSSGLVSIAQPDLMKAGGVSRMLKVAAIAEGCGAYYAPHNAASPLATVVNSHVSATASNFLIQECFDDTNVPWARDVLSGAVTVTNGYIEVPQAPGFGVELHEEEIAKHPYGNQNFLKLFEPGWERRNM